MNLPVVCARRLIGIIDEDFQYNQFTRLLTFGKQHSWFTFDNMYSYLVFVEAYLRQGALLNSFELPLV